MHRAHRMQSGFFDDEDRLAKLDHASAGQHSGLASAPPPTERRYPESPQEQCRAQAVTLMFKMLALQALYNTSDKQTEPRVRKQLSLQLFLGRSPADTAPDPKTLRLLWEQLTGHGLIDKLFQRLDEQLWQSGLIPRCEPCRRAKESQHEGQLGRSAERKTLEGGGCPPPCNHPTALVNYNQRLDTTRRDNAQSRTRCGNRRRVRLTSPSRRPAIGTQRPVPVSSMSSAISDPPGQHLGFYEGQTPRGGEDRAGEPDLQYTTLGNPAQDAVRRKNG